MELNLEKGFPCGMSREEEAKLIAAGAMDEQGYIFRTKLREAWLKISDGAIPMKVSNIQALNNADRFLMSIYRSAKNHEVSFNAEAERLGY